MTTAPRPSGPGFGRDPSAAEEAPRAALSDDAAAAGVDRPADRFHNREDPSASEMAEMLREVQDTLAMLDGRLDGLEGAQGESSLITRRLAVNVAEMGEALARRMRSIEGRETGPQPAPPAERLSTDQVPRPAVPHRRESRLALSLGMAAALALALAGFWLFGRGDAPRAPAARPAPRAAPPVAAPTPIATAPPVAQKAAAPRRALFPLRPAVRRSSAPSTGAAKPAVTGPPTTAYRSFGPAAGPAVAPASPPASPPTSPAKPPS